MGLVERPKNDVHLKAAQPYLGISCAAFTRLEPPAAGEAVYCCLASSAADIGGAVAATEREPAGV